MQHNHNVSQHITLTNALLGNTRSNFAVNHNLREQENTHKIVNGVRPMLPTSPNLLPIIYYQSGKFLQAFNSHPDPKYTQKNYSKFFFSQKKLLSLLNTLLLCSSLFWDEEQQQDTSCIYRNDLRGW